MTTIGRGVSVTLGCLLLVGCLSGSKKSPPRLPHESSGDDEGGAEVRNETCSDGEETTTAPFDQPVANGMLQHAMDRAWSCGLHTVSHFDLTLSLRWGNSGCVARVTLENEVPSTIGECLVRRFEGATIKPFSGASPSVVVRMTNDRSWWSYQ